MKKSELKLILATLKEARDFDEGSWHTIIPASFKAAAKKSIKLIKAELKYKASVKLEETSYMRDSAMHYGHYKGSVEFDLNSQGWRGRILHQQDLVTYKSKKLEDLFDAFIDAARDYDKTRIELAGSA
jgi:hypothetical protein